MLKKILNSLEDFFLPEACACCGRSGSSFCPACRAQIKRRRQICPVCGTPSKLGLCCLHCQKMAPCAGLFIFAQNDKYVERIFSAWRHRGAAKIGVICGKMMGRDMLTAWPKHLKPHIEAWPTSSAKQRRLGLNPSLNLAVGLSTGSGWPLLKSSKTAEKHLIIAIEEAPDWSEIEKICHAGNKKPLIAAFGSKY